MTPERWQQIDQLFHSAVARGATERAAFLAQACAGEHSLRLEVESLLESHEQSESFIEAPVAVIATALLAGNKARLTPGQSVGPYKILSLLGEGGMGEVYLAQDSRLERQVALKRLPLQFTLDQERVHRFQEEARAAAKLDHPNICAIHEITEADGRSYIVMQYVEGETLGARLERKTPDLRESIDIAYEVAGALAEAHSHGIVHRDIKPQNVMITPRGQVKVLDFGLAKRVGVEGREQVLTQTEARLSAPGLIVGTAPYMSPEQAKGTFVDARSDLFSLGAMLYECVTGQPLFSGATAMEIRAQVIQVHPVAPSQLNPEIPPYLDALILKAVAKEPERRYQSARDFRMDLRLLRETSLSEESISINRDAATASGFTSVFQALRRPRVFIPAVSLVVALFGILIIAPGWRTKPAGPSSEAMRWYEEGTNDMRNGSYYQASKALQLSVGADDNFVLAHARLAEAYTELDYADKASHEILRARALVHDLSPLPELDSQYVQAITHTVLRENSAAIESYKSIAAQVPDSAKPQALVDLGRAYERNDENTKAKESYALAIQLAPSSAAAFLRLGKICGQQQDFKCAYEAFGKAEKLYHDLGDFEGVTEVMYQRGLLLKNSEKPHEARTQLEAALKLTETTDSIYQKICALLALSSVAATEGQTNEAEQHANEAIILAQANRIENQATSGLIWLGNAFLARGDYAAAEKYYWQGLELAKRDNGRHNQGLALAQLGSLRMQQRKTDEGLSFIEQALPFFKQGGYRKELSQVLTIRGRGYRDKGDYETALSIFKEQLQLGEQAADMGQVALAEEELGSLLTLREDYTQALQHFDKSYELNKSLRAEVYVGYAAMHRASVLWQIGRYRQAEDALAEAVRVAHQPDGDYKHLLANVHMVRGQMEASAERFSQAKAQSLQALALAGGQYQTEMIVAKSTQSLAEARIGARRASTGSCRRALQIAEDTRDPAMQSSTWLACSETMLANGEVQPALELSLAARENFARVGQLDSEWRAWLIAARASQSLGETAPAREYASNARDRLMKLEQKLGSEAYKGYRSRKDVQQFQQQLKQLAP